MTTPSHSVHPEVAPGEHAVDDLAGTHVPDAHYIRIAIFLAVATGVEVALSYTGLEGAALVVPLLAVMAYKFYVVGANFMHLKYDPVILTRIFYFGIVVASIVYVIVLMTFQTFGWQH